MCTTTSHWETHISTECSVGGTAQCDGMCIEHGKECTCSCHRPWFGDNLPTTVEGVRDWHDEHEQVWASVDGTDGTAWFAAVDKMEHLKSVHPNREFKVLAGQYRTVVTERY